MHTHFAKTCFQLLIFFLLVVPAFSQNSLKGKVVDSSENKKLQHAIVALIDLSDTTLYRSWRTDAQGNFELTEIPEGKYQLMISYPKMADFLQTIPVNAATRLDLGNINMLSEAKLMQEVIVTAGKAIRMRGDTLEYTADSFAVRQGANLEALLKRLPGIQVTRNGQLFSNGQEIRKMLVDGEEFFTDDPKFAMQYLKAGAVDKVQVYDRASDESMMTGFNDGQKTKTMNVKLKDDAKKGFFGKVSTGANGDGYYNHEAMIGAFKGTRKAGVFGFASKSLKQGTSFDIAGKFADNVGEMITDGIGGGMSMQVQTSSAAGMGIYRGSGIPTVLNGNAHFSDKFNQGKQYLSLNYGVRNNKGNGWSNSTAFTQLTDSSAVLDKNENTDNSSGMGQSLSARSVFKLDSASQLSVYMQGGFGDNESLKHNSSSSANQKGFLVNSSEMNEDERTDEKVFSTMVSYNRKLKKFQSNINIALEQEYSNSKKDNKLLSVNRFYDPGNGDPVRDEQLNRLQEKRDDYQSYGGKLKFTSKLSSSTSSQVEYGIKTRLATNRFNTLNNQGGKYDERVDSLSNNYDLTTLTQIAGIGVNIRKKQFDISAGSKVFFTGLRQRDMDNNSSRNRNFTNINPYFTLDVPLTKIAKLNVSYRGSTEQPTLDQIQPLQRSTNQLVIQEGNPDLEPGFNHGVDLRMSFFDFKKRLNWSVSAGFDKKSNGIANATIIDEQNRRISRFVNVDGLPSYKAGADIMKSFDNSGISANFGINYNRFGSYTLLNRQQYKSFSNSYGVNAGIDYRSGTDLELSYRGTLNITDGKSTLASQAVTRNLYHHHMVQANVWLPGKINLGSIFQARFNPSNNAFAQNVDVYTWDAMVTKKFLKNENLSIKLEISDILNNNTGYRRTLEGLNWHESNGFVMKRYFMITASWDFAGRL